MDPIPALANRVNQGLADSLVKNRLCTLDDTEEAMPQLKQHLLDGNIKQASLLKILCWDLKRMNEGDVLDFLVDEHRLGYCNPANYTVDRSALPPFKLEECWATMALPFDQVQGVFFVATAHYLSEAVRDHWVKRLRPDIIWFASDLSALSMGLDELEKLEAKAGKPKESETDKPTASSTAGLSDKQKGGA
ncbi:MAG: hypothetical protein ACFE0O_12835 [Opitutales bacterium]